MEAPLPDAATVLVLCPTWVGDTVMATVVLRALRDHRPRSRLVVAGRPGVVDLLAGCPWVDERVPVSMRGAWGPWRAAHRLRGVGADAALILPNSFRSALVVRLARVPVRIGYDRDARGRLLTARAPVTARDRPVPAVTYYADLAAFALATAVAPGPPALVVTDDERRAADELLAGVEPRYVVLNPGAVRAAKRWPAERFARVADLLRDRAGLAAVVSGGPDERAITAAVAAAARSPVLDLAARGVTLPALKAVLARAQLLITNDTGPRHVAAALGTPTVSLFGPTDHRWTTLPVPHERVLLAEPFLPEALLADRHPRACAIDRIPVADVAAAALQLLDARRTAAIS